MPVHEDSPGALPVDSDIDLHVAAQRQELACSPGALLAVISLGGALGALARYGIGVALPAAPGRFPLGTFLINIVGCLLIGVLMVLITEARPRPAHPLLRPFLGVGVLGGFTTFATYTEEVRALLRPEWMLTALGYLLGTLVGALVAVWLGLWLTRLAVGRRAPVDVTR